MFILKWIRRRVWFRFFRRLCLDSCFLPATFCSAVVALIVLAIVLGVLAVVLVVLLIVVEGGGFITQYLRYPRHRSFELSALNRSDCRHHFLATRTIRIYVWILHL